MHQTAITAAVEKVRVAYDERTRDLTFKTMILGREEAAAAIRAIGQYNDYDGNKVAKAVDFLFKKKVIDGVCVGREGSPVLYLHLRRQRSADDLEMATAFMKSVKADELHMTGLHRGPQMLRAWWD